MRVLFASVEDAREVTAWSGTPFHMVQALTAAGVDVVLASPLGERLGLPWKAVQAARNALGGGYYSRLREPSILAGYAAQVARAVARTEPDLVLSPSTLPVARLGTAVPVVTWTDATFAGMAGFYPSYTGLSPRYTRLGHAMERSALDRVSLAVYSSEWAARTARESYGVPVDRTAVVPYGANLPDPGPRTGRTPDGTCRLLLVGRGWHRKGIDLAVATAVRLRQKGVPAVLDVVGSTAPEGTDLPPFVTVHGPLEKDDPVAARRISGLYEGADFFLLPTRADCSPVVLAEAQAHGVPVVTSDVGGTASLLRPGHSGWTVGLDAFPDDAAALVAGAWQAPEQQASLRREARRYYERTLTWERSAAALLARVAERRLV